MGRKKLVERKNLVEITFPERRLAFDDSRMFPRKFSPRFLDSTRFRWFVHIVALPPFVHRDLHALPLYPPLVSPLFRFPDFHNFFRSQFFRFPISSLPPSAFLSLINAAWSMREISAGKLQFRTASKIEERAWEKKRIRVKGGSPPLSPS